MAESEGQPLMTTPNAPLTPKTLADLAVLVGQELGPSQWQDVPQERIDAFAAVTGDDQWIHIDTSRAAVSPAGTTIAHGLLTLSLGPTLCYELISFSGFAHSLNYGYDSVRFPAPLPAGSRVRMTLSILEVAETERGIRLRTRQSFEREGQSKPVAVAESVSLLVEKG
jgi:acyl dehydratase